MHRIKDLISSTQEIISQTHSLNWQGNGSSQLSPAFLKSQMLMAKPDSKFPLLLFACFSKIFWARRKTEERMEPYFPSLISWGNKLRALPPHWRLRQDQEMWMHSWVRGVWWSISGRGAGLGKAQHSGYHLVIPPSGVTFCFQYQCHVWLDGFWCWSLGILPFQLLPFRRVNIVIFSQWKFLHL